MQIGHDENLNEQNRKVVEQFEQNKDKVNLAKVKYNIQEESAQPKKKGRNAFDRLRDQLDKKTVVTQLPGKEEKEKKVDSKIEARLKAFTSQIDVIPGPAIGRVDKVGDSTGQAAKDVVKKEKKNFHTMQRVYYGSYYQQQE